MSLSDEGNKSVLPLFVLLNTDIFEKNVLNDREECGYVFYMLDGAWSLEYFKGDDSQVDVPLFIRSVHQINVHTHPKNLLPVPSAFDFRSSLDHTVVMANKSNVTEVEHELESYVVTSMGIWKIEVEPQAIQYMKKSVKFDGYYPIYDKRGKAILNMTLENSQFDIAAYVEGQISLDQFIHNIKNLFNDPEDPSDNNGGFNLTLYTWEEIDQQRYVGSASLIRLAQRYPHMLIHEGLEATKPVYD